MCGFYQNVYDNYEEESGCDLTIQPIYYTLNITEVFKGNYTVSRSAVANLLNSLIKYLLQTYCSLCFMDKYYSHFILIF